MGVNTMKNDTILRRSRAALLAGLVGLLMLCTALPASADDVTPVVSDPANLTWEGDPSSPLNISWE